MLKRLVVVAGPDKGRFFFLPERGPCTLGTSHVHTGIRVNDPTAARAHCVVNVDGELLTVTDLDSPTGTFVNGKRITERTLEIGDVLRLGGTELRLEDETFPQAKPDGGVTVLQEAHELEVVTALPAAAAPTRAEAAEELEVVEEAGEDDLARLSGRTLAYYEVGDLLGRGYSGAVFRARAVKVNQVVALKVLHPSFPADEAEMEHFIAVLKPVLPLRHPNLVRLYGVGRDRPYCWVAREYVHGESLARLIERRARYGADPRPDSWRLGFRVALDVARALKCAHGAGLRHGHVTPANVLLSEADRRVKLADLMLGKSLAGSQLGAAVASARAEADLAFRAPELTWPGSAGDARADLYGLGAVVYAVLARRPPFRAASYEELLDRVRHDQPPRLRKFVPGIPREFEQVVEQLLAKDPEERYRRAAELVDDLEWLAGSLHQLA